MVFVNFLGLFIMVLAVSYHYLTAEAKDAEA
jgi:hypothetical protein